ncbi:MAG: hypothetical protein IJ740_19045 [Ruminococcus sp.]|nr:hypothetical protein [Ruminococcus sp.]MBR1752940.1 hypothetical protein [Ruminococcus sp.]
MPANISDRSQMRSFPGFESELRKLLEDNFTGVFGTNYGFSSTASGDKKTYTVWSLVNSLEGKTAVSGPIHMETKEGITIEETLVFNAGKQNCLYSTKIDPVDAYIALAGSDYPSVTVTKKYTDLEGAAIEANALSDLLENTEFIMYYNEGNTRNYVQAVGTSRPYTHEFTGFTADMSQAARFRANSPSGTSGIFIVDGLPTDQNSGRWYYIQETKVPGVNYTALTASVFVPALSTGTKSVSAQITNTEKSSDFDSVLFSKDIQNSGFTGDEEFAAAYEQTGIVAGFTDGTAVKYFTKYVLDPAEAMPAASKNNLKGEGRAAVENSPVYSDKAGQYYIPVLVDGNGKISPDPAYLTTDMNDAAVIHPGSDITDKSYFGKIFLNLIPNNNKENFVFVEVQHPDNMGYITDDSSLVSTHDFPTKKGTSGICLSQDMLLYYERYVRPYSYVNSDAAASIINAPVIFDLAIYKRGENNEPVAGAEYALFKGLPSEVDIENDVPLATAVTDERGRAYFDCKLNLAADYTYAEIKAPKGYVRDTELHHYRRENLISGYGRYTNSIFLNYDIEGDYRNVSEEYHTTDIRIQKIDSVSLFPLADIRFDLYCNGEYVKTAYTDADGYAQFTDLPLGKYDEAEDTFANKYTVREVDSGIYRMLDPEGNVVSEYPLTINGSMIESDDVQKINCVTTIYNKPVLVDLKVIKTDDQNKPVKGVKFDIVPKEDIVFRGVTIQRKGEIIGTIETDANGYASSAIRTEIAGNEIEEQLPIMAEYEYELTESYTPAGYEPLTENITFMGRDPGGETLIVHVDQDVLNNTQKGHIKVVKVDEKDNTKPLAGAVFELTCADTVIINGKEYAPGKRITTITTNAKGIAQTADTLPVGHTYYLTEITPPPGYTASNSSVGVLLDADAAVRYVEKEVTVENTQIPVEVSKTDITTGELIEGAKLQIRTADGTVLEEWTSSSTVPHTLDTVLVKDTEYVLHEEFAAEGYVVANDVSFTVNDDGSINRVKMEDDVTKVEIEKIDADTGTVISGAVMQILDGDTVVEEWTSTTSSHKVYGKLAAGKTYVLHEVKAPAGYELAKDQRFTVSKDGRVDEIKMKDKKTETRITKKAITGDDELPGAVLTVLDGDTIKDKWVSGTVPHSIFGLEKGKTYTLREETAPDGYSTATDIDFVLNNDGTVTVVEMRDDTIDIDFHKLDDEGNELPGAKLRIVDSLGNVVKEWTSEDKPYRSHAELIGGLTYTLEEIEAPDGYNLSGKVEFTVPYDGSLERVDMMDKPTVVEFSKKGLTGEEEIPGAKIAVYDEDGNEVETWISTDKPHIIKGKLIAGKKYTMHEVTPPVGYAYAEDKDFTVSADGSKDVVVMNDDTTKVEFEKVNSDGDPVDGATLQVIDPEGIVLDEWVTSGPYKIEGKLKAGIEYTLHEKKEAPGYVLAADIPFTVSADGSWDTVKMTEKETKVSFSKKSLTGEEEIPGALLRVIDEEGRIIDEWTSTDKPHIVKALLEAGKSYILREEVAPTGYVIAEDYDFTVSTDGGVDVVTLRDDTTKIHIAKYDADTNEIIPGAVLQVLDGEEVIDEWISDSSEHEMTAVLQAGKEYILHEIKAPSGYVIADDIRFTVSVDGRIDKIAMTDRATLIHVSKKSVTGEDELPGAVLKLYDGDELIEEWTSADGPHVFRAVLEVGKTYTLHEEIAPDGYIVANDVEFTVEQTGEIQTVTMRDDTTKLEIAKYDADTGAILAGAIMQILDGETVAEEWTTTNEPHRITAKLTAGKEYILHEKAAPENYELSEDIPFTVSEDGTIDRIEMSDSEHKGTVEVHKVTEGMVNVEGIKFTLEGTSDFGNEVRIEALTDENGIAVFDHIPVGTYTVTEDGENVAAAYLIADSQSVEVFYSETSTVTFENLEKTGSVEVHKKTEGMVDLNGIKFVLTGTSDSGRYIEMYAVTDKDGKAVFDGIPIGIYTITEDGETVPAAYLSAEPESVEVFYGEKSVKEIFNEEKSGSIKVNKTTEGMMNVKGIRFILSGTSDSGRMIAIESVTDEKGIALFDKIPLGTYTITEDSKTVPAAYLVAEEQEVTVIEAKTVKADFVNAERTGSIEINKKTTENKHIEGITFILSGTSDSGREIRITAVTDKNGKATFTNIPVGTYTVTEDGKTVPMGYLAADSRTVTVTYAKTSTLTVDNSEQTGSIEVHKTTDDMKNISGIKFILSGTSDTGREIRLEAVTDSSGKALFSNVPVGVYEITEDGSTVPTGYLTAEKESVTVTYGKTTIRTINNDKKPDTPDRSTPPNTGASADRTLVTLSLIGAVIVAAARKRRHG